MKSLFKNFLLCGIAGWCWECFWTGLHSLRLQQPQLLCRTSLWMFPIYGAAAFLCPLFTRLKRFPLLMRSLVYAICIFIGEYLSGSLLKRFHACPWNYSHAKLNIDGIIRLDFLPAWMLAGILFEKIVLRAKATSNAIGARSDEYPVATSPITLKRSGVLHKKAIESEQ